MTLIDSKIAYRNNIPWVHAGKQTRACLKQAQKLADRIGANKRAILLGLPAEREGARMILNGTTFNIMVSPPFLPKSLSNKFILFAPIIYGNDELINMQRYKDFIGSPDIAGTYVWNSEALKFEPLKITDAVSLSPAAADVQIVPASSTVDVYPFSEGQGDWKVEPDGTISTNGNRNGSSIVLSPLNISSLEYDFLEFDLAREPSANKAPASVFWIGQNESKWQDFYRAETGLLPAGKEFQTVRLPLSRHWRWLTSGNIVKLRLDLPATSKLKVKGLKIVSAGNLVPGLTMDKLQPDNTGVYTAAAEPVTLIVDGACVPDCQSVKIELSKPNFFFENLPESMVSATGKHSELGTPTAVLKSFVRQGTSASLILSRPDFPAAGYYQLRASCLNKDGMPIGERSDPLTLFKAKL